MSTDPEVTRVIFRKWHKSVSQWQDIIAIFPDELGTNDPYTCTCYEHVGQHGDCDPIGVVNRSDPATPAEYADLKQELESIGYRLQVVSRNRYKDIDTRRRKLAAMER